MGKRIDLSKTVAQLVREHPEVKDIMVGLGFKDIASPAALMFMGKVMTIPKGSAIKGIPMERIVAAFEEAGFEVVGADLPAREAEGVADEPTYDDAQKEDKNAQLRALIERLNAGEDLESVRADFVSQFESVAVDDIVAVEQALLDEGMPLTEVQRACDLHSALFHGHNEGEACSWARGRTSPRDTLWTCCVARTAPWRRCSTAPRRAGRRRYGGPRSRDVAAAQHWHALQQEGVHPHAHAAAPWRDGSQRRDVGRGRRDQGRGGAPDGRARRQSRGTSNSPRRRGRGARPHARDDLQGREHLLPALPAEPHRRRVSRGLP